MRKQIGVGDRRALVTGGAGFIGSHLVARLLGQGCDVTVVDDLSNGRLRHVERFSAQRELHFVEGDIVDRGLVRHLVREREPDVVYHLAALHFIPACVANPLETLRVNVLGTQAVLEALPSSAVKTFVFSSTADVYRPKGTPHAEGDPTAPQNIYGESKLCDERLLDLARRQLPGLRFVVARLFNAYGPGETNPHVIPDILEAVRKGDVLPLGNVEARRDYVHCADVAEALVRLGGYQGACDVFNVGTGRETSVREIVALLGRILGRELTIARDEERFRSVDRPHLCADTSRLARELGWVPPIGIVEGLRDLLRAEGILEP